MVGKTNLELESIVNKAIDSQRKMESRLDEIENNAKVNDKKVNSRFEVIEKKLDDSDKKSEQRFKEMMDAIISLQHKQYKGKEKASLQTQQINPFAGTSQSETGKYPSSIRELLAGSSKTSTSQQEQPPNKSIKPTDVLQPSNSALTFAPKRKCKPIQNTQYHTTPPKSSENVMAKEGAVNLYRPAGELLLPVTEREKKIRTYFPDFFPHSEAENPDGPLREASSRNRVSFPREWKLKYANSSILENLYMMQVAMIQSMLPYTAWPIRVSLEMDEDFIAARTSIHNHSLDWAGAVDCYGINPFG